MRGGLLCAALLAIVGLSCASIAPACDIHVANDGYRSPAQLLPLPAAQPAWLYADLKEIGASYRSAKAECEAYLNATKFDAHAEYYTDNRKLPPGGQQQCRGTATLQDLTGMLVWPFGPAKDCPTYSKCWFGLLACGTPKLTNIKEQALGDMMRTAGRYDITSSAMPDVEKWSIQAVRTHSRVVGPEITVPDQRLLSVPSGTGDQEEVIILQYHLTLPGSYAIEVRQMEFYPGMLMPWAAGQEGMENAGRVFLGGTESRCPNWSSCNIRSNCCGCDEKSMVTTSPIALQAADGSGKCPVLPAALPLCAAMDSKQPGRWIQSSNPALTPHCEVQHKYNLMTEVPSNSSSKSWGKHASGNPCIHVSADHSEDMGSSSWFYAPYSCRYHFYTRDELQQCFAAQGIRHIHFQGDSMSRDLFGVVSKYVGVELMRVEDLKRLTNELKMSNLQYHAGTLMLSEGYNWHWDADVMRLTEQPPLPDVLVINHGIAHRTDYAKLFERKLNETERKYWLQERNASIPMPKFRIFQNARDLHGMREPSFIGNNFRQNNEMLRQMYGGLGFAELDEFLLTAGRIDTSSQQDTDGWHFKGSTKQMEAIVLFNMICNNWYQSKP